MVSAENLHRDANLQHRVCSRIKRSLRSDHSSTKLLHEILNDDAVISTVLITQHTFTVRVT